MGCGASTQAGHSNIENEIDATLAKVNDAADHIIEKGGDATHKAVDDIERTKVAANSSAEKAKDAAEKTADHLKKSADDIQKTAENTKTKVIATGEHIKNEATEASKDSANQLKKVTSRPGSKSRGGSRVSSAKSSDEQPIGGSNNKAGAALTLSSANGIEGDVLDTLIPVRTLIACNLDSWKAEHKDDGAKSDIATNEVSWQAEQLMVPLFAEGDSVVKDEAKFTQAVSDNLLRLVVSNEKEVSELSKRIFQDLNQSKINWSAAVAASKNVNWATSA